MEKKINEAISDYCKSMEETTEKKPLDFASIFEIATKIVNGSTTEEILEAKQTLLIKNNMDGLISHDLQKDD